MFPAIVNLIVCFVGLGFLICFSYVDYYTHRVENEGILLFFVCSLLVILFIEKSVTVAFLSLILGCIGVWMWKLKIIGGADVKILFCITPFFLLVAANNFTGWFTFLVLFGVIGTVYGLMGKKKSKKKKYVAFIPAITLTYFVCAIWLIAKFTLKF